MNLGRNITEWGFPRRVAAVWGRPMPKLLLSVWFGNVDIRHSRSYEDCTKKIQSFLDIVNQGRRFICLIHCNTFWHRQLTIVGLALHIFEAFIGRNKPILLSHVWKFVPWCLPYVRAFIYYKKPLISHLLNYTHTFEGTKVPSYIIIIDMNVYVRNNVTYPQ